MSTIQDIFSRYGPEYLDKFGDRMPANHRKTLQAIMNCGNGTFGMNFFECDCGNTATHPCCCGDRHCPICQHAKADKWLKVQLRKLLPCEYFMVTFTVPEEARAFLRQNQRIGYYALFDAAAGALKKLARDPRFGGAEQIGATAVLHTWGRILNYNPHIHFIVPGGGLSSDRNEWRAAKPGFFIHVEPLAKAYKNNMRNILQREGLLDKVDPAVWNKGWNVNSQAVGNGSAALTYLAKYVFRIAISNNRIISVEDNTVSFQYQKPHSNRMRTMKLDTLEFIRRFLQHVLPKGFMKIRHYGFLSANPATTITRVRELICVIYELVKELVVERKPSQVKTGAVCDTCGKTMKWKRFLPAYCTRTG